MYDIILSQHNLVWITILVQTSVYPSSTLARTSQTAKTYSTDIKPFELLWACLSPATQKHWLLYVVIVLLQHMQASGVDGHTHYTTLSGMPVAIDLQWRNNHQPYYYYSCTTTITILVVAWVNRSCLLLYICEAIRNSIYSEVQVWERTVLVPLIQDTTPSSFVSCFIAIIIIIIIWDVDNSRCL